MQRLEVSLRYDVCVCVCVCVYIYIYIYMSLGAKGLKCAEKESWRENVCKVRGNSR